MRDELLQYYERELTYLRQMGADFAAKYPKIAARLVLEPDRCEDPHVERLLEAFAFLAARVHLKVDDDFPEITESLLSILYPQYIRPIPSMSIVEFRVEPHQVKTPSGFAVARDSMLFSRPVDGVPCRFRTCYETRLSPITVAAAEWTVAERVRNAPHMPGAAAVCRLELAAPADLPFEKLEIDRLRFFLSGDAGVVHTLYELLVNNCFRILVRQPGLVNSRFVPLPPGSIRPVGFEENEAVLPNPRRAFAGHRLLQEYFAFPEKFFFVDLNNLRSHGITGNRLEFLLLISRFERADRQQTLELGISERTFRLHCTPVVNLFSHTAEPVQLEETKAEYQVIPDLRRRNALEIYAIDEVVRSSSNSDQVIRYEPFYSYRHTRARDERPRFWHAVRRPSTRKGDGGTDIWITLADPTTSVSTAAPDALTVRCTCTNRDLPSVLPFGDENGDFELEGSSLVKRIVALRKPTPTLRPPTGKDVLWRHISHLSLNYLSLVEEGKEALQEILRLYNFTESPAAEKQINGVTRLASQRRLARVMAEEGFGFARGVRVELELDEDQFVGAGAFLFASVLERYFGLYVSINSFCQLAAFSKQRKEAMREWAPRAGTQTLL